MKISLPLFLMIGVFVLGASRTEAAVADELVQGMEALLRKETIRLQKPFTLECLQEIVKKMDTWQKIAFGYSVSIQKEEENAYLFVARGFSEGPFLLEDLQRPIFLKTMQGRQAEFKKGFLEFCLDVEGNYEKLGGGMLRSGGFTDGTQRRGTINFGYNPFPNSEKRLAEEDDSTPSGKRMADDDE